MKVKILVILLLVISGITACGGGDKPMTEEELGKLKLTVLRDMREKAESPIEIKTGVNFSIKVPDAKYVSIVGDFNNWIDNRNPMTKNSYGVWSVTIPLKKGTYSYKFNIDGAWVIDPNNPNTVKNNLEDIRSVVKVKKSTPFYTPPIYRGYTNSFPPIVSEDGVLFTYKDKFAHAVSIGGNFNNWEKNQNYLTKNKNGIWSIKLNLPRGKYYYKFNVDGIWKYDPQNKNKIDDGMGDYKSMLVINEDADNLPSPPKVINYDIVRFEYYNKDLSSDLNISVIGDFNNWKADKNIMTDNDFDKVWFTTVRLTPDDYFYKFSINGHEFLDPKNNNVKIIENNKKVNSLKVFLPDNLYYVKFSYKNKNAENVYVVGDFNNWDSEIDKMELDQYGLWYIVKKLKAGDYGYMFVVDNKWIIDPINEITVRDLNNNMKSYVKVGM